ncbi:MAG: hypothetical protein ABSA52_16725 [Candidatus Binatia bacterium]|jgi:hypothetical protein
MKVVKRAIKGGYIWGAEHDLSVVEEAQMRLRPVHVLPLAASRMVDSEENHCHHHE